MRMPVELVTAIVLELPRGSRLGRRRRRSLMRQEAHHRMAMMPGGLVAEKLAGLRSHGPEHHHPRQEFRVADLVQLIVAQSDEGIERTAFHMRDGPPVQIERRL